jgi:hypothetical protein
MPHAKFEAATITIDWVTVAEMLYNSLNKNKYHTRSIKFQGKSVYPSPCEYKSFLLISSLRS